MRIYVNEEHNVCSDWFIDKAPIAGDIETSLTLALAREGMIVQERVA